MSNDSDSKRIAFWFRPVAWSFRKPKRCSNRTTSPMKACRYRSSKSCCIPFCRYTISRRIWCRPCIRCADEPNRCRLTRRDCRSGCILRSLNRIFRPLYILFHRIFGIFYNLCADERSHSHSSRCASRRDCIRSRLNYKIRYWCTPFRHISHTACIDGADVKSRYMFSKSDCKQGYIRSRSKYSFHLTCTLSRRILSIFSIDGADVRLRFRSPIYDHSRDFGIDPHI